MNNTDIVLFRHEEFGEIRTLEINGEPWFVSKDVALTLGYTNPTKALNDHVDKEDMSFNETLKLSRQSGVWLINESGLYSLILSSKLPNARAYKRWVTSEVLPSIRKHGAYLTAEALHKTLSDPRELAKLLTALADEQEKNRQLATENAFLTVKAGYYDRILNSKNSVPVTQIAQGNAEQIKFAPLKPETHGAEFDTLSYVQRVPLDYGMTAVAFNKMLHEFKVQYPVGKAWVLYADYANKGYTQSKTYSITEEKGVMQAGRLQAAPKPGTDAGQQRAAQHTCWTQAGRLFLYQFLMERGILPVCEQEE